MRTTTTRIDNAISAPVQTPAYLVEISFSNVIRLSTKGTLEWNGFTWYQGGAKVGSLVTGQAGVQAISVSLANNASAYSTIVLAETASGKRVRIWKLFGEPGARIGYPVDAGVLVFDGLIDDVPELGDWVTFNCTTKNSRTLLVPNITIGAPYFNFLPRAGQVLYWGLDSYELQPR